MTAQGRRPAGGGGRSRRLRWAVPAALLVAWLASGFRTVAKDEQGVVLRFGRVIRTCPAGMHWLWPWPFENLERVKTSEIRTMTVGYREGEAVPRAEEAQWLTGDTNIVELRTVVQYLVRDAADYLFRVADPGPGRPRDLLVRKATESVLTALVAERPVDDVLGSGKAEIQREARLRLQAFCEELGLGIQVHAVHILAAYPPAEVIAAFNDVSSAKADRERSDTEADGYAKDLLPKARARADRIVREAEIYRSEVVSRARGEAERFTKLAREVAAAPGVSRLRLWMDSVQKALARARKIIYPRRPGRVFHLKEVE